MSAYATPEQSSPKAGELRLFADAHHPPTGPNRRPHPDVDSAEVEQRFLDLLVGAIADRIASAVAERLVAPAEPLSDWLDSRAASRYLGVHRDTLRKLAAERAIPAEQNGPGCKLFFRRTDLEEWRRSGGRASGCSCSALARIA